jgi:hypothetical protein
MPALGEQTRSQPGHLVSVRQMHQREPCVYDIERPGTRRQLAHVGTQHLAVGRHLLTGHDRDIVVDGQHLALRPLLRRHPPRNRSGCRADV